MAFIYTERLIIRPPTLSDAAFMLRLVNDPSWLNFIGDRKVHTIADAENYLLKGSIKSYQENGFGFGIVLLKEDNIPIGTCGFVKRPSLDDVDMGYAFLPEHTGYGYAIEASKSMLAHGIDDLHFKRIIAITTADNVRSINLLEKIGFQYEKITLFENEEVVLFGLTIKES